MTTYSHIGRQAGVVRPSSTVITRASEPGRRDWSSEQTTTVEHTYEDLLKAVPTLNASTAAVRIPSQMAKSAVALGRLDEALSWCVLGLRRANDGGTGDVSVSTLHRVMAEVLFERDETEMAIAHVMDAVGYAEPHAGTAELVHALLTAARVMAGAGRIGESRSYLDEARRVVLSRPIDHELQQLLIAQHVRTLLQIGEPTQAKHWAPGLEQYATEDVAVAALALRLRLSTGDIDHSGDEAFSMLRHLQADASLRTRVEVGTASAVGLEAAGRHSEALVIFGTTLQLAEKEGFVRSIAEYGLLVEPLLDAIVDRGHRDSPAHWSLAHVMRLRKATIRTENQRDVDVRTNVPENGLREPLSERELQVLRLLGGTLSNREIGNELYLSVNTVKTHVKSLYSKLGVNRRIGAVNKARELGLLRRTSV